MIAIKSFDIPKTCEDCPMLEAEDDEDGFWYDYVCKLIGDYIDNTCEGRDERCPLIECIGVIRKVIKHTPRIELDDVDDYDEL